jgi:hypothetical protein
MDGVDKGIKDGAFNTGRVSTKVPFRSAISSMTTREEEEEEEEEDEEEDSNTEDILMKQMKNEVFRSLKFWAIKL